MTLLVASPIGKTQEVETAPKMLMTSLSLIGSSRTSQVRILRAASKALVTTTFLPLGPRQTAAATTVGLSSRTSGGIIAGINVGIRMVVGTTTNAADRPLAMVATTTTIIKTMVTTSLAVDKEMDGVAVHKEAGAVVMEVAVAVAVAVDVVTKLVGMLCLSRIATGVSERGCDCRCILMLYFCKSMYVFVYNMHYYPYPE